MSEISLDAPNPLQLIHAEMANLGADFLNRPGGVFYSGREAFSKTSRIYFLGLNPGGSDQHNPPATILRHYEGFLQRQTPWSEYLDESWEGARPGVWGMQPKVLHMMRLLNLDPRLTPASNLIFVRTPTEAQLAKETQMLAEKCWPVHRTILTSLGVRVVVCFGQTTGAMVRQKLGAHSLIDHFRETNRRGWASRTHKSRDGKQVVTVTHPSRANWCNEDADPTKLAARALDRSEAAITS